MIVPLGSCWELSNETFGSSRGQPVLVDRRTHDCYRAGDLVWIGDAEIIRAGLLVQGLADGTELSYQDQEFIRRFLT